MLLFVFFLAAFGLPLLARVKWLSTRSVVYQGPGTAFTFGVDDLGKNSNTRYCWFSIPGSDKMYMSEIPNARFDQVKGRVNNVVFTLVKYAFTSPFVESVEWAEGEPAEVADKTQDGLLIAVAYGATGMLSLILSAHLVAFGGALLLVSALFLALSGAALNLFNHSAPMDLKEVRPRMAGIPLGKGAPSLVVMLCIALVLTVATFSTFTMFTLFPGIHAAFAAGAIIALLYKANQAAGTTKVEKS